MSFIRPEARAVIWRWREVLFGTALAAVAIIWALGAYGVLRGLALVLLGLSVIIILAGVQRSRFRGRGGGQGVVQVIEGQISYFGPLTGGAVAISDLAALSLDGRSHPPHWLLVPDQGPVLHIPISAEGSDALFDAFAGLQGLRTEHLLRVKQAQTKELSVVWRRADVQALINRSH